MLSVVVAINLKETISTVDREGDSFMNATVKQESV